MLSYNKFLTEGVYDPHIFKAFFLAGGPGSGKSYVQKRLFAGTGMKVVNSDNYLTNSLKKAGQSLDLRGIEGGILDALRGTAKRKAGNQMDLHIQNRLGIVIDGTGRDYDRLADDFRRSYRVGYDNFMVFVNTSLDVALARNEKRARKVAEPVVEKNWKGVQANIGKFQRLFGLSNFVIVDNNRDNDNETNAAVFKVIRRLMRRSPSSWQAKAWVRKELEKKRRT